MRHRVNAKHLRHNALARYINEASYSFVNEGFLNEKKEPCVAFSRFFRSNSSPLSPVNEDPSIQESSPIDNLICLFATTSESVPAHPELRQTRIDASIKDVFPS